ncbi:hypothetical protein BPOR_0501g00020 [Botrytis porri]|uniref:Uncharacterized protein n=1 Tax=Botrytis porri TaxID=87229 RepID=A0A4Z1KG23_9HELO|nr:hypothetical protein BPOR_0501g00020 [Botrytis porri]
MSSPPPIPQPQLANCRTLIRSPDRVDRWMQGTGEFSNQPMSPSNNVPNSPPSGNQYGLDDGVILSSPSVGSRPQNSPHDVFAAPITQENMRAGAGFTDPEISNAPPNQALAGFDYEAFLGELQQRNEHILHNMGEYPPIPNLGDNAHQDFHDGNNRVDDPYNMTALQNSKMNTSLTPHKLPNDDIIGNDYSRNMMPMDVYSFQPRYDDLQPFGQGAHRTDANMTTGMMNTTNNHQQSMGNQVMENIPLQSVNPPHYFADIESDLRNYQPYSNYDNGILPNNPGYQGFQGSDYMLWNYGNMAPTQPAVQSYGDRMSNHNLAYVPPQHVIADRFEDSPYGLESDEDSQETSDDDDDEDGSGRSLGEPINMASDQSAVRYTQSPTTVSGYISDQRVPGLVGTGLNAANAPDNISSSKDEVLHAQGLSVPNVLGDMPSNQHTDHNEQDLDIANVPDNMQSNQHIVHSEQGNMPTSGGAQMDTLQDQILSDAAQPFNTINYGPYFPQDTSSRQALQLDSNPTLISNFAEPRVALNSREADTRSARYFPPNLPSTMASSVRQSQMETPRAVNPFRNPARNEKSDTRKNSSRSANRVNKSIRRKRPAKTQKLQSAIANSALQLLGESTSQAVEAQNDPENSKSQAVEAQDESETSYESVE